jgi:hypothetical protein
MAIYIKYKIEKIVRGIKRIFTKNEDKTKDKFIY